MTFSREGATGAGGAGIFACFFLRMRTSACVVILQHRGIERGKLVSMMCCDSFTISGGSFISGIMLKYSACFRTSCAKRSVRQDTNESFRKPF